MPTLTKDNAKNHCRTCLKKLGTKEAAGGDMESVAASATAAEDNELEEFKDIYINITTNLELRELIAKYINEKSADELESERQFPQNVCFSCYNRLQNFEKFRKRAKDSAEKLNALLSQGSGIFKVEIDYEDMDGVAMTPVINNDDIYKLLLKDTLMETESVMLNSSAVATLASVEMHDPDPFDTTIAATAKTKRKVVKTSGDDGDDDGDNEGYGWPKDDLSNDSDSESSSNESSDYYEEDGFDKSHKENSRKSKQNKIADDIDVADGKGGEEGDDHEEKNPTRRTLRSGRKKPAVVQQLPKKKRRRTKKEMEEWRNSQKIKLENKIKRRNKGTKNSFKCTQCNHCFAHKITLDAHVRKIHEGSKRPFQCDRCDKSYTFIGGLYTHIKEIHETEVRSYSCDFSGCDRVYTSFIAMQKHKRIKHTDTIQQKKYVCEQCGATFNQTGNLKYHRRTKHPTEAEQAEKEKSKERFECEVCNKLFHSRYTLKYHTLQIHTDDMKYECNICGRRMAKKFMLVQHMLVHSTDKMPCEHCGKQFIRKFELEAHIRAVHMKLKPFECQYCTECFASRKTLRHHEYIHTGEKPYVCDICGQAYRQQTCLKNHRKSHEKLSAEALLAANINRTFINSFIVPQAQEQQPQQQQTPQPAAVGDAVAL